MKVESSDSYIKHTPKHYTFTKIVFFIFGVSSLSGWNAVLTALDFFSSKYHGNYIYIIHFRYWCSILFPSTSFYIKLHNRNDITKNCKSYFIKLQISMESNRTMFNISIITYNCKCPSK